MANIFRTDRTNNKIELGTTGTTINIASHTASKTLALDASKNLISIQDLRTTASPIFAGLTVVNAITEFSTDGTMAGDSDSAVPTEKATKLYTDTLRSDLASVSNAKGASLVGVEDSASLYTATNVETALAEVMDKVTPVTTTGNSITTLTGTVDAGDINSTITIDDADSYDVSEVTGAPGFDIQITFTGITSGKEPNKVQLHIAYDGSAGHNVDLEMWNYTGSPQWDVISADFLPDTGGVLFFYEIDIPGTVTDYVSGGESKLRFNHTSSGNANHDVSIDFAALKHDLGSGAGVTEHGALSGLLDNDHTIYIQNAEFTQGSGILVGTGAGAFQEETGVTLRTSIGLGNVENTQLSTWAGSSNITTLGTITTVGNITIAGDGTIGQAAGPLLTFDDTNDFLEITGCKVVIGGATATHMLSIIGGASDDVLNLSTTRDLANIAPFVLIHNRGTGNVIDEDNISLQFVADSDTTANALTTYIRIISEDVTHSTRKSAITFLTANPTATEKFRITGNGALKIKEIASADADTAAYGQIWVKTATPNQLWFTNDAGTDVQLGLVGGTYVDRGDPAAWDFVDTDLTTDGTWNTLDLSGIVPAGAKTVLLRVRIIDDAADKSIQMRENGNSNGYNVAALVTLVALLSNEGNFVVGCDANRVIEYNASNTSWTNIDICVRGWWT